jgi:hypothetical protein
MTYASVVIAKPGRYASLLLKRYYKLVSARCREWLGRAVSDRKDIEQKPISILQSETAHEDEREWAERCLCGMTSADEGSFMSNRLAQS